MKIKAKVNYWDLKLLKDVSIGDIYEVSEERGKEIIEKGYAEEIIVPKREKKVKTNGRKES